MNKISYFIYSFVAGFMIGTLVTQTIIKRLPKDDYEIEDALESDEQEPEYKANLVNIPVFDKEAESLTPVYWVDGKPVYKDDMMIYEELENEEDELYEQPPTDGDYDPTTPIHPISQAEWEELDKDYFDPVTWDYYEDDGIVIDEVGDIVPVPLECLGLDAFEWFGKYPEDDKNLVYIVNPQLKMVFELIKHQESYTETMYGIDLNEEFKKDKSPRKFRDYDE